jgi:hypothetical protein
MRSAPVLDTQKAPGFKASAGAIPAPVGIFGKVDAEESLRSGRTAALGRAEENV